MAEYNSTEWKKGDKITSSKLNNIESGIANTLEVANSNSTKLDNIQENITALTEAVDNLPGEHTALNDRVTAIETNLVSKAETNSALSFLKSSPKANTLVSLNPSPPKTKKSKSLFSSASPRA